MLLKKSGEIAPERMKKERKMKSLSHVRLLVTPWSLPGSSVHGIFQARVLEWVVISFSRGSSLPRNLLAHFVPTEVSGEAECLGSL